MRTKAILAFFTALIFNLIAGTSLAMATGLNPTAIVGGGMGLSMLLPRSAGVTMAIQKEIWMSSIVEGLFANNSFLSKAFNADEFVNAGKTVHIPNAGAPSGVVKNRSSFPATVTTRTDIDLTFNLDEFTTDPIRIPHADTVELSYNKRESVISQDRAKLIETVSNAFITAWSPASTQTIRTTGGAVLGHMPSATNNRKAFVKGDVQAAMVQFNKDDVPADGRYLLLDAVMHAQLLDSLTDKEALAFYGAADMASWANYTGLT